MPLTNTNTSSQGAVIIPEAVAAHRAIAVAASQNWVATSQRRRSSMSASAPLGKPSRNTGRVEADWTSATQIGVLVSVVIVHAAATSFIHMHRLAVSQVLQSRRKTGMRKRLERGHGTQRRPPSRGKRRRVGRSRCHGFGQRAKSIFSRRSSHWL